MATGSNSNSRPSRATAGEWAGHPLPTTLAAYLARELAEGEREALREHLAVCSHCARLALDLHRFEDLQPPAGHPPVSEGEMKDAWKDLRERLHRDPD